MEPIQNPVFDPNIAPFQPDPADVLPDPFDVLPAEPLQAEPDYDINNLDGDFFGCGIYMGGL